MDEPAVPRLSVAKRPTNTRKRLSTEDDFDANSKLNEQEQITASQTSANEKNVSASTKLVVEHSSNLKGVEATTTAAAAGQEAKVFQDDSRAIETETSQYHRATETTSLSGHYHGKSNYFQYLPRQDTIKGNNASSTFRAGPARLTSNIRNSVRFDYAPDLCKDYNETGFCGFGDSCKFLHDRGDYKAGWELDAEWEEQERYKLELELEHHEEAEQNKETITTCGICEKEFTRPVVETKCGHLFCERCALEHARTSSRCKVCSSPTNGSFKIVKMLSSNKR